MPKPIDEKLLRIGPSFPDGWSLAAQKCGECGTISHPLRYRCPRCGADDLADVVLEKTGTIKALTRVHQTSPDSVIPAPYWVALIQIDSGPVSEAVSAAHTSGADVSPGDRVTLVLDIVGNDEAGEEIAAYRFSTDMAAEVTT